MGKATDDLRTEHESILYVLKLLAKMLPDDPKDAKHLSDCNDMVYFFKTFADKCHHGKEEIYLFPTLIERGIPKEGGPIGVMLREHDQGRGYIAQMTKALETDDAKAYGTAAKLYADLLFRHIEKENDILFKMADQVLDGEMQQLMSEQFERFEQQVIGHGVHEQLHAMIESWTQTYDS